MTLRADSYSSTAEVKAFTRHLLDGQTAFNSTTRPTATELERFIDRASAALNVALAGVCGLTTPITNSTAALLCADWVTMQATAYVELTQRGEGFSGQEGSRHGAFVGLAKSAQEFAQANCKGFSNLGAPVSAALSRGLQFTGLTTQSERDDPTNSDYEQPLFIRRQFDDPNEDQDGDA